MKMIKKKWLWIPLGILSILCFLGIYAFIQEKTWAGIQDRTARKDTLSGVVPASGEKIKPFLLGFDMLSADLYWLKVVQYLGGNALNEKPALFPFLNLITDLDPKFSHAYKWALSLLPSEGYLEETEKMIAKGEEKNADDWEIFYNAGYYYFYYKEDNEKAMEYYEKCLQKTGCIEGAKRMLLNLKTRAGKYETAIANRLEELAQPNLSEEDIALNKKKVKEAADLMFLNEAAEQFRQNVKEIFDVHDLKNVVFETKNPKILEVLLKNSEILGFSYEAKNGKVIVNETMLLSPFEKTNPYVWDSENNRVTMKLFLKKHDGKN